jgi:erythromycin esterase-like protein
MVQVFNIGFTTHTGTVAAADEWDSPVQLKAVRQSMPGLYEHLFHSAQIPQFALDLRGGPGELREALAGVLWQKGSRRIFLAAFNALLDRS